MSIADVLLLLVVVLAVAGVAVFATRWSARARTLQHTRIRAFNALLERVAMSRSLRYESMPDYVHPMLGSFPQYGTLGGSIDGLALSLEVTRTGLASQGGQQDHVDLLLDAGNQTAWPAMKRGSRAKTGPAFMALNELSSKLKVDAGRLLARPHCGGRGSSQHVQQRLFERDDELLEFLDLAVRTCAELRIQPSILD